MGLREYAGRSLNFFHERSESEKKKKITDLKIIKSCLITRRGQITFGDHFYQYTCF